MEESMPLTNHGHSRSTLTSYVIKYCTICCIPYKGALLVLLWSALLHSLGLYVLLVSLMEFAATSNQPVKYAFIALLIVRIVTFLLYPVSGLLAETVTTRFKVMIAGSVLTLIGLTSIIISVIIGSIEIFNQNKSQANKYFDYFDVVKHYGSVVPFVIGFLVYLFGLSIFEANAIQFGTDQLQFANNDEFSKFVHWYVWTLFVLQYLLIFILPWLIYENYGYILYWAILQTVSAFAFSMIALIVICCCRNHLLTEPVGHTNPVKLIIKVIDFGRRHKQPVRRSAFTYGDLPPSRLDLGKERYGGPFTTEEVEDVKSFGRIFLMLLTLFGLFIFLGKNGLPGIFFAHYIPQLPYSNKIEKSSGNVFRAAMGTEVSFLIVHFAIILGIPMYMCLLRPCLCYRFHPTMIKKMGIGILLIILGFAVNTAFIAVFNHTQSGKDVQCFDASKTENAEGKKAEISLFVIAQSLYGLGYLLVFLSALEFILAQAPCSMRGLLIGLWYTYQSLGVAMTLTLDLPLSDKRCHYWVYIVNTVLAIASFISYIMMSRCYKYRQREEHSDVNCQAIIEEYTERQLIREVIEIDDITNYNIVD